MGDLPGQTDDPTFPGLHIRPARGWVNDPNGLCRIDGRYHVFFQHNPHGTVHDRIHWGHVSSVDLLHWTQEPLALVPRPGRPDAGGCWSGCVTDDGGVPTAVYTAVADTADRAGVTLARSDRTLRAWVQDDRWQLAVPAGAGVSEVRDPYVFVHDGHRYAVQGAGSRHGPPLLLLYSCDDLTDWSYLGPLLTTDDPLAAELAPAQLWECPNLFPLGQDWVLLVSLWQFVAGSYRLAGVRWFLGELVGEGFGLRYRPRSGGVVDAGQTCYAPQVLLDGGRALLWGWAWEGPERSAADVATAGWAGVLTFPRELAVVDGVLASWAAEIGLAAGAFEIESAGPVRLRLVDDAAEETVVDSGGPVRVLVDGSLVEVFAGPVARTSRAYPTATSRWLLEANRAATTVWRLGLD